MKWLRLGSVALLAFTFVACDDIETLTDLDVTNQNNPDRERALAEAGDIEGLISGAFFAWWEGLQENGYPTLALSTAADELSMSWGNFGMQQLSSEPREPWPNTTSWNYRNFTQNGWYNAYTPLSSLYDALLALEVPAVAAEMDVVRARSFAKLVQGLSHAWLAMMYDSAFVLNETVSLEDVLELQAYPAVAAEAVANIEEAISIASGGSFTTPPSWINGNELSAAQLVRYAHSQLARIIPRFARDPAERAAVDWASVISHVDQGITEDFMILGDAGEKWDSYFIRRSNEVNSNTWGRADYKTIGLYDTSGEYQTWLGTFFENRDDITIVSADARVNAPGDGEADGTYFQFKGNANFPANRGTEHHSRYGHKRYGAWVVGGRSGLFPHMLYQGEQLQKAEGLLRTGNKQGAVDIINVTRVGGGNLPPAQASESVEELMIKLNYERRIENFAMCSGCAYFDRRGLGPLVSTGPNHHDGPVEGTPTHFAVPGLELEILAKPPYTYGGVGSEGKALGLGPIGAPGFAMQPSSGTRVPARAVYLSPEQRSQPDRSQLSTAAASLTRYH